MKVTVENETYLMHWETRKFHPTTGKNQDKELEATDCIIRKLGKDAEPMGINTGHVSQTAHDRANGVTARRLSFLKAIEGLDRPLRAALGHEYNKTCRVTSNGNSRQNRKLKAQIKALKAELESLKDTSGIRAEVVA